MNTQRFNSVLRYWNSKANYQFMGFTHLLSILVDNSHELDYDLKMIEIGSYMGESTFLFGSCGLFSEIHTIDPHEGEEEFNDMFEYDWDLVKKEFKINIRFFDNIIHHQDYSYNVVDKFEDGEYDFIYIDANHSYEGCKQDLELYLPKLRDGGMIGGHDYEKSQWPGVVKAVNEIVGEPDTICWDTSWIKKVEDITIG